MAKKISNTAKKSLLSSAAAKAMRVRVLDFAQEHNLVIHPGNGYDYYIEGYLMFNHCPCDPSRPNCPCPESLEEIKTKGHCKCILFWKDNETFRQKYFKEEVKE